MPGAPEWRGVHQEFLRGADHQTEQGTLRRHRGRRSPTPGSRWA